MHGLEAPRGVISPPSSFFAHSHTSGSWTFQAEITFRGAWWGGVGKERERKQNNQRKKQVPEIQRRYFHCSNMEKMRKTGAHCKQEHVYAFINISNVDLISVCVRLHRARCISSNLSLNCTCEAHLLTCPRGDLQTDSIISLINDSPSKCCLHSFFHQLLPPTLPSYVCETGLLRGDGLPTPWYCPCALGSGTLALVPRSTTNFIGCVSLRQEVIICKIWPAIRNFFILLLRVNWDSVCRALSTWLGTHWALSKSCGYSFFIILLLNL